MNLYPSSWPAQLLRLVARLRNDGINSSLPVTEINGGNISTADADIALVAKGAGATVAQVPDGTTTGGNKRGSQATDWQKIRTQATQVALGSFSTVGGGSGNTASGQGSVVGGGSSNSSTSTNTVVGGGNTNSAASQSATVAGGSQNLASGIGASVVGGADNTANGDYACVLGGRRGTTRSVQGFFVLPACNIPIANTTGITQSGVLILARETTTSAATILASNNSAATSTNQIAVAANSAYSFSGEVIAGVTGAGDAARWTINGAIKRGATVASTVMVGSPTVTMTHNDAGAAGWAVAVTADTTNGSIAVTVTGAAATTIRWVCRINTVEMTY